MKNGLTHVYTGNGKGKTTASVGLAVRAAGDSKKVLFVQFLKDQKTGELASLESLPGVTVRRAPALKKFSWDMTPEEKAEARTQNDAFLAEVIYKVKDNAYDLLVLDESLGASYAGLLDEGALLAFVQDKPEGLELVLTGRNPSEELVAAADYVTEMKKIKHPFDKGVKARRGVEY